MERTGMTRWLVLLGIVVVAFAGTVLTLNLTLFSASGFVGSYLQALARHDAAGALAMPGVTLRADGSHELLVASALGELSDIQLKSDVEKNGVHAVTYEYRAGSTKASTTFAVKYTGPRFGLFSGWSFSNTPIGVLDVTPLHDAQFTANGASVTSKAGPSIAAPYLVLTPGNYVLSHTSQYLTAPKTPAIVTSATVPVDAKVDIEANPAFVRQVQKELDEYLAKCVTQKVLLPTGCPMGKTISDRIQSEPTWSMVKYPVVKILPARAGTWAVPATPATAHLVVTVKSIFDGKVTNFDQDVPFTVRYLITFQGDGSLLITAQN